MQYIFGFLVLSIIGNIHKTAETLQVLPVSCLHKRVRHGSWWVLKMIADIPAIRLAKLLAGQYQEANPQPKATVEALSLVLASTNQSLSSRVVLSHYSTMYRIE